MSRTQRNSDSARSLNDAVERGAPRDVISSLAAEILSRRHQNEFHRNRTLSHAARQVLNNYPGELCPNVVDDDEDIQ